MSAEEVANAFINHYYTSLASNPQSLIGLYQPKSTLTFEGCKAEGPQNIMTKLTSVKLTHDTATLTKDVQMSLDSSAMLIFITGKLKVDNGDNALMFSETFQLVATGPGQYYVNNQMFRLIYG